MADDIYLNGYLFGTYSKARKFQADSWDEADFIPISQSDWTPEKRDDESVPSRGQMRIAGWLAKKNGWEEA